MSVLSAKTVTFEEQKLELANLDDFSQDEVKSEKPTENIKIVTKKPKKKKNRKGKTPAEKINWTAQEVSYIILYLISNH